MTMTEAGQEYWKYLASQKPSAAATGVYLPNQKSRIHFILLWLDPLSAANPALSTTLQEGFSKIGEGQGGCPPNKKPDPMKRA